MRSFKEFLLEEDEKRESNRINPDNAFATAAKTIYGKKEYLKNTKNADVNQNDDKVKPMEYLFQFGKGGKYQVKFTSDVGSLSTWSSSAKGCPSENNEEQGKYLSTILDILDQFSSATIDPSLEKKDIGNIYFDIKYTNENQLEAFKKMFSVLNITGFRKKARVRENQQKYMLILSRTLTEEHDSKKEEEINLDMNDGYGNVSWKTVFGKSAYDKHMKTLDKDDDEHVEKIEPMVYVASFGKNYQAKFESVVENDTAWVGSLNKAIPSDIKEQGLVLSTIMDILDDMSKGEPDADFEYNDIKTIRFGLTYNDEEQLKIYKKMLDNLHVPSFNKSKLNLARLKEFSIILRKN